MDLRCPYLTAISIGSPDPSAQLQALCPLKRLTLASHALQRAHWWGFGQLETMALACPGLTRLDLAGCLSLGDDIWSALGSDAPPLPPAIAPAGILLPPAGCPNLRCAHLSL